MPRNIKTLIKGLTDSPIIKEDWDITPITGTTTPDITFTQLSNCNSVGEQIVVDITGVTGTGYVSAVKTNITMQTLETDKTIKIGLIADDIPLSAPCLVGLYVAPASLTTTQVKDEVYNMWFSGQPLPNNRIIHYVLSFGSSYQAATTYRIPNAVMPTGVIGALSNTVPGIADLKIGSKTGLLLSRRNNNLYIGRFDVHSDGVQYDLNGTEAVVNSPVLADSMTVFYISLVADQGGGLQNLAYTPSVTLSPPSYDITGTSVEAAGPPDSTDWVNFANPVRPSYTSILQATLPTDVRIGQFYRVTIDPSYTGIDPTPYGYPLKNNQTVLINSITGAGNITAYVDNESLIELTNDIIEPFATQQTLLAQSVSDFSGLIQQTQEDVNVALLNAPEVVVYVKDSTIGGIDASLTFSTAVTFNTFHLAYQYLIALPKFIKKRIVIDDRGTEPVTGVSGVMYYFLENNITLSTYMEYLGLSSPSVLAVYQGIYLTLDCTGLLLDKFRGAYAVETTPIVMREVVGADIPLFNNMRSPIIIGDNCALTAVDSSFDFTGPNNKFFIGDNSEFYLYLYKDIVANNYQPFTFYRGKGSRVTFNQGTLLAEHPLFQTFVTVNRPFDDGQDTIQFVDTGILYTYTEIDPFYYQNTQYTIVRHIRDLGIPDANGYIELSGTRNFLFVVSMEFYIRCFRIAQNAVITLRSLPAVTLTAITNKPFIVNNGICRDYLNHLIHRPSDATIPLIENNGSYYRVGGKLTGFRLFTSNIGTSYGTKAFHLIGAEFGREDTVAINQINTVGNCNDFLIKDLRLSTPLINIPLVQLDVSNITAADKYAIDGVHGTYNTVGTPTYGILDIVGTFIKDSYLTTETIAVKRIDMSRGGSSIKNYLITRNGAQYAFKSDTLFDYDGRKLGLSVINGSGSIAGNGTLTNPLTIIGPQLQIMESGWIKDTALPTYYRYQSREVNKRFLCRLKADIYRTVATGNAMVGIKVANPSTGVSTGTDMTFTLGAANERKSIEIATIISEIPFNHAMIVTGGLVGSTFDLSFENVMFTITEV